jgi:hypothetical protein
VDSPITNMIWITPPRRRLSLRVRPTLYSRTIGCVGQYNRDISSNVDLMSLTSPYRKSHSTTSPIKCVRDDPDQHSTTVLEMDSPRPG